MNKVIIIAEAGVNHNGDMALARQLIDAAAEAGADYVKFQTFKTANLVSPEAKMAGYQVKNLNEKQESTQFEMLKKLELSQEDHYALKDYCKTKKIKFLSTAFDLESIDFLLKLGIDFFKIPSGEITNYPYLKKIANSGLPVVLSTGMSTMEEIKEAIAVLREEGINSSDITVLHCNTEYPTPFKDVHLNAMKSIEKLGVKTGYSDHTLGIEVPVAAVALGAKIIEKHFTMNRNLPGPDHKASLQPDELKQMINSIRNIEVALGSENKTPSESEIKNLIPARKSIHYAKDLVSGHIITENDLTMKRPGDGISPMKMKGVIGKKLTRNVKSNEKAGMEDFS